MPALQSGSLREILYRMPVGQHSGPRRLLTRCSLENKRIAVVGATRGIGLEFARQLLAKHNQVFATTRSPETTNSLQDLKAQPDGERLVIGQVDTTDVESIQAWVESVKGQTDKLDAVFNVAGAASWKPLNEVDSEEMLGLFTVNTVGPLLVVQRLLRAGLLGRGALIANMTSKMGSMGDNSSGGTYAYRASKAGINSVTKSMSIDLADKGITAVVLHPGWVRTDMTSGSGLIDAEQSVRGLISVVETEPDLNGRMFDYKHEEVPW